METLLLRPHLRKGPVFVREIHGTALVLIPHGPLSAIQDVEFAREAQELLEVLGQSTPVHMVIDLQHGEFAGSAFLGAVVRLWKRIAQNGGRMALCHVSANVTEILRLTKLHAFWPIYVSRDEALRAVAGN